MVKKVTKYKRVVKNNIGGGMGYIKIPISKHAHSKFYAERY